MQIATSDCSPPESADRFLMILPGGATWISMPLVSTSDGSDSTRLAAPPPNSSVKMRPKCLLMRAKLSANRLFISSDSSAIILHSWVRLVSTSFTCARRNSYRSLTSAYSSMAATFTLPSARTFARTSATCRLSSGRLSKGTQSASASDNVSSYSSHSLAMVWSYSSSSALRPSCRRLISRERSSRCWFIPRACWVWRVMEASFSIRALVKDWMLCSSLTISRRADSLSRRTCSMLFSLARMCAARSASVCSSWAARWRLSPLRCASCSMACQCACASRLASSCARRFSPRRAVMASRARKKAVSPPFRRDSSSSSAAFCAERRSASARASAASFRLVSACAASWPACALRSWADASCWLSSLCRRRASISARMRSPPAVTASLAAAFSSAVRASTSAFTFCTASCAAARREAKAARRCFSSSISCRRVNRPADRATLPPV